ncbi:Molybdopterin molybdenumtransferase [hydrothermal vent metagenome]|uniref:Molybdopterin molybdenumtransferase n=1 Tax=hydrothermal vent metagenome TaxID=652676 RepID=A0A3B0SEW7_9ZZZZ
MITYSEALEHIAAHSAALKLTSQPCALAQIQGRVLASPVEATANLPAFDNSAMDGFAMRANPAQGQIHLPVCSQILAGDAPAGNENPASAVQIMTGAPVPNWCQSVVPIENVTAKYDASNQPISITTNGPIAAGQHIRLAGQDVRQGDMVLPAGRQIGAGDVMMLAALGVEDANIVQRPKIALISTGAELIDDAATELAPGQIRNSNQPFLVASLANWPVQTDAMSGHPDTLEDFIPMVERALENGAHIIISTGAVSMGVRDFVPDALRQLGAEIIFHKCKIRPGKPILLAKLPNGTLFFGLPGNPVSAAVGFRFFVLPALRHILGMTAPAIRYAKLTHAFTKRAGFCLFAKAKVQNLDGQMQIEILPGQQSFRIAPLLEANCWAQLPQTTSELAAGELLQFHQLTGSSQ